MSALPGLFWLAMVVAMLGFTISPRPPAQSLKQIASCVSARGLNCWRSFSYTDRLAFGLAILGLIIALWPRIVVDFSDVYDAESPFPASVTISNHQPLMVRPFSDFMLNSLLFTKNFRPQPAI